MITNKVKALLSLKNSGLTKYAEYVHKSQPTISNKAKRDTWKVEDLLLMAKMTNTRLAFIDNETNRELISFDENDIRKNDL